MSEIEREGALDCALSGQSYTERLIDSVCAELNAMAVDLKIAHTVNGSWPTGERDTLEKYDHLRRMAVELRKLKIVPAADAQTEGGSATRQLVNAVASLYSGDGFRGDPTELTITGHVVWLAQQASKEQQAARAQHLPEVNIGTIGYVAGGGEVAGLDWREQNAERVARAFWRRIYPYRNEYEKELPIPCPVEFTANMTTALSAITHPQPAQQVSLQRMCELLNGMMDGTEGEKHGLIEPWKSTYERLSKRLAQPAQQGSVPEMVKAIADKLEKVEGESADGGYMWDARECAEFIREEADKLTTTPQPECDGWMLTDTYKGMRISAEGVLGRVRGQLKFGAQEMLKHLEAMAESFYSGNVQAVDQFLQTWDLDAKRPNPPAEQEGEGDDH